MKDWLQRNIDNFTLDFPDQQFPQHRTLNQKEADSIRKRLRSRYKFSTAEASVALMTELLDNSRHMEGDAEAKEFDLREFISSHAIPTGDKLLINTFRFDELVEFSTIDVEKYFDYLWYPGSDDIEIVDPDLRWVLSVTHYGALFLLRSSAT